MSSNAIVIKNGVITQDPKIRDVGNTQLLTLSVATDKVWKDKNGERQKKTCYHEIKVWGKAAVEAYEKAQKLGIVTCFGSLEMETWDDKNTGQKRHKHTVSVDFPEWESLIILPPRQYDNQPQERTQKKRFDPKKDGDGGPYGDEDFEDTL